MPIINTQRRLAQAGRIRAGETSVTPRGKRVPRKLSSWRLTSPSKRNLDGVAAMYGGRVQQWTDAPNEGQWELYTEASELVVVVLPETLGFSQWMELWSGGGCLRRCDGYQLTEQTGGGPCQCDPDFPECSPQTRLSVLLAGLPGVGLWRLDTKGRNAQAELAGAMEMAELLVEVRGLKVLPGTLRLDQRSVKRPDPEEPERTITFRFAVPVLDFNVDMAAIAEGDVLALPATNGPHPAGAGLTEQLEASLEAAGVDEDGETPRPPRSLRPVPERPYRGPRQQILDMLGAEAPPKRPGSAPQLPPSGVQPRTAAEAAEDAAETRSLPGDRASALAERHGEDSEPLPRDPEDSVQGEPVTDAQIKRMQTLFTKSQLVKGMDRAKTREFKLHYCNGIIGRKRGQEITTSKAMTVAECNQVIEALQIVVEDLATADEGF